MHSNREIRPLRIPPRPPTLGLNIRENDHFITEAGRAARILQLAPDII